MRYIVGVDEVGRGPLAGPVSIGIVVAESNYEFSTIYQGLRDSKLMTEMARKRTFEIARAESERGVIRFGVYSTDSRVIDELGIEVAIQGALARGMNELAPDSTNSEVFLDGRLKAPEEFTQSSIIHGDNLIPVISLASVVAKVTRDSYMETQDELYPVYGFSSHKGYGTARHLEAIRGHGPSPIHRMSFLRNVLSATINA